MNLLTNETRLAAIREVTHGQTFSMSLPLDYPGGDKVSMGRKPPQLAAVQLADGTEKYNFDLARFAPAFTDVINDDVILLHTQYSTQWDALGHVGSLFDADGDGKAKKVFYNGYRGGEHLSPSGEGKGPYAHALGIDRLAETGVQGRGVLVDLHAVYGRERIRVGYAELMEVMAKQGAEVRQGDFLCLYTGFADLVLEMCGNPDAKLLHHSCAGLAGEDQQLLDWITHSGVAAICSDNSAVEAVKTKPRGEDCHAMLPLHEHCLFKQGIHLGELWYFSELANWLDLNGRRSFLLTAPPLRMPGSVGSPVTPVATV
ncbi:cyclase [Sphingobium sp. SCG-1]|uniref:cyclase family protein n=1 Tax=Sphingobium sp. SCG-1 TaxID=2072936 RepID=UPI000CD6C5EE|nr:cyclase family protein [Sphingobium sp. SCG-1]AUW57113.1 cyclase [Sphingobium sp. SCG-1]